MSDEKIKEEFFKPSEKDIPFDEKDDDETLKNDTSPNSPYLSKCDITVELNNLSCEKLNDVSTISIDKTVSPFISYFLCNEKYIKENEPEGYNYQKKSRNFVSKNNLINFNKVNIEDVDLNKVNDILKDIEFIEKSINNTYFNTSLNNVNKEQINFVDFPKEKDDCNIESNNLYSNLNGHKLEGK